MATEFRMNGRIDLVGVHDAADEITETVKALYLTAVNIREDITGSDIEGRIAPYVTVLDTLIDRISRANRDALEAVGAEIVKG